VNPLHVRTRYVAIFGGVLSVALGLMVAVVSSPGSLSALIAPKAALNAPPPRSPSPSPVASPTASPLSLGKLGAGASLFAAGSELFAFDQTSMRASGDQGATWSEVQLPPGAAGLVVDHANPSIRITGGGRIEVTTDGGATWKAARATPPGAGPFTPAMVSVADANVWLVYGNGRLVRTRDGGISWRAVPGLPAVTAPSLAAMPQPGLFVIAIAERVFELVDNGTSVRELPPVSSGGDVTRLAVVSSADPPDLMASTSDGHIHLLHAGAWQEVNVGLNGPIDGLPTGSAWLGNGGQSLGSAGQVSITTDGGLDWTTATGLPADQSVDAIAAEGPAGKSVWAYCAAGDLYHSTDGGRTWILASQALRSASGG